MAGFGVSDMTVYTYRQGTSTKDPLPSLKNGTSVGFDEATMVKWGKKYGVPFDAAAALKVPGSAQRGPKPPVVAKEQKAPPKAAVKAAVKAAFAAKAKGKKVISARVGA